MLRKAEFDFRRGDGRWQRQARESYDIGDGAAVLPMDRKRSLVLMVRQFRWPAFENGYRDTLIEAIAGKLDGDDPEQCAIKEAEEEAGIRIQQSPMRLSLLHESRRGERTVEPVRGRL